MKKTLFLLAVAATLAISAATVFAEPVSMTLTYDGKTRQYNAESIELLVNGNPAELSLMPPVILDGRTYVPSREVFEPLGAVVDWKDASRELYIGYNGVLIVLIPGENTADINGLSVPLEAPAKIINNKLMIPVRFVAESLGIPVGWDSATRTVSIGSVPEESQENPLYTPEAPAQDVPAVPVSEVPSAPVAASGTSVDISAAPLTEIAGGAVDVTGFKAEGAIFTISTSGAITKAEKLLLPENKLVLDIHGATNALPQGAYDSGGFSGVSAIRNSQFQVTPTKITRIVFDLSGSTRFDVSFGAERKSLVVKFEENTISDISHRALDAGEQITVTGTLAPQINAFRMFSPEKLVLDITGARFAAQPETAVGGRFTDKIRASQFDAQTARIVLDLNESPAYKISYSGNTAVITLFEPTYKNIAYSQQPQSALTLKAAHIDVSSVTHTDDYLNGRYILSLPGDFSTYFGEGQFDINDSVIDSVTLQNYNGRTEIIISQKAIYAYTLTDSGGDLVICPVNPKAVYKNVVYIDAGHGLDDPGANTNGFMEKDLNLGIVQKLHQLLQSDPEIKVYASRLDDSYPENIERARTANHAADLFVSVHHNAADNTKSGGTETLYLNHEGEVYPKISSEAVARIFQTNLVHDIGTTDRGVVKRPNLIVLNQTKIPAVLVEVIFMTNSDDINKVSTQEGRDRVAESLYRSIREVFQKYPTGR